MSGRNLVFLAALVGCVPERDASSVTDAAVAVDAVPDAPIDESLIPFTTTGTTPAGSLDDVRFMGVDFLDGFCPPGYTVRLYRTNQPSQVPVVRFEIPIPVEATEPPTGTVVATAWLYNVSQTSSQVAFEIVHVDIPPTEPLRIAGRITASSGGWNLDISIDANTERLTCI